jgi:UDP-N-acetyl-D-mannosaminuronate dehydrogenase
MIGIFVFGEIGKSIEQVYLNNNSFKYDIRIKDLDRNDDFTGLDILNVCIPYHTDEQFIKAVSSQISEYRPTLTIIHSTVSVGTTNILTDITEALIVHSPVRGVHPNLYEGIMTFVKFIGADVGEAANLANLHFKELGISTHVCNSSRTTELGKLFSTTYYGLAIAWHGEMEKICKNVGVSFDQAVTAFNETYNEGYKNLEKPEVVRPVLYPPSDGIGGHCILPNVEILKELSSSLVYELINQYKKGDRK